MNPLMTMPLGRVAALGLAFVLASGRLAFAGTVAADDASSYSDGWKEEGAGTGFGPWSLKEAHGDGESHAGFFLADNGGNPEITPIAPKAKAFGLYANGVGFEAATAFRSFTKPLETGNSFALDLKSGTIAQKFDKDDPGTGAIGFTLRSGNESNAADDYNKGSRFEFGYYEGQANFQIYDGEENHDSGVAFTEGGVHIAITLTAEDTYDLEITTLVDGKKTKLSGRKFGSSGKIESFCLFNRDGEKADGFFNTFAVSREGP